MELISASTVLKELGHATRLGIYKKLVKAGPQGLPVGDLQKQLEIPASTLSHHISSLISVALVRQERQGRTLYCHACYEKLSALIAFLTEECCTGADGLHNMPTELKNVDVGLFDTSITEAKFHVPAIPHPPRILMLYGSVRERSYSRLATEEAARLLTAMGAEVRIFNPSGLPLPDDAPETHPKVMELRELVRWSEGMVWCSPERHGAMTGIMKAQIDWIPLSEGAVRPSQGKTLAVMQVCGGSQSFNAVNQMRILGRWMRMITIPNQSSVAKAWQEFDEDERMKPSSYYDRIVDVMEELVKFTLLTRGNSAYLVNRYSERKESAEELSRRVNQSKI